MGVRHRVDSRADERDRPLCLTVHNHHEVVIDGVEVGTVSLPSTRGFGKKEEEWAEVAFPVSQGLPAGKHTLSLRSGFGARSVNLDRLGLGYKGLTPSPVVDEKTHGGCPSDRMG